MQPPASLQNAGDGFASVVRSVGAEQWEAPTPCDGWTVRDLVGHVVAGSRMVATLAAGGSRDDAIAVLGTDHLGTDPGLAVANLDDALRAQLDAFSRPDIDTQMFEHPAGDMPGAVVLRFRIGDLVVHRWDVARAIGADETIDVPLVEEVWNGIQPMLPMISGSGVFGAGPSGDVADDAPLQLRLLDALGRRP